MWFTAELHDILGWLGDTFRWMADRAQSIPIIRNWIGTSLYDAATYCYRLGIGMAALDQCVDDVIHELTSISDRIWDRVTSHPDYFIDLVWNWVTDNADRFYAFTETWVHNHWDWFIDLVWNWITDNVDRFYAFTSDWVTSNAWRFYDYTRDAARSTWFWLDNIEDKIRDVGWDFTRERLFDFLEFSVTSAARVGYRILNTLWNMEWDDENKEVKS